MKLGILFDYIEILKDENQSETDPEFLVIVTNKSDQSEEDAW